MRKAAILALLAVLAMVATAMPAQAAQEDHRIEGYVTGSGMAGDGTGWAAFNDAHLAAGLEFEWYYINEITDWTVTAHWTDSFEIQTFGGTIYGNEYEGKATLHGIPGSGFNGFKLDVRATHLVSPRGLQAVAFEFGYTSMIPEYRFDVVLMGPEGPTYAPHRLILGFNGETQDGVTATTYELGAENSAFKAYFQADLDDIAASHGYVDSIGIRYWYSIINGAAIEIEYKGGNEGLQYMYLDMVKAELEGMWYVDYVSYDYITYIS